MIDRLAAEYGWTPAVIEALPAPLLPGLLDAAARRRRETLADGALCAYAGLAAALNGPAGATALEHWAEGLRRGEAEGEGMLL